MGRSLSESMPCGSSRFPAHKGTVGLAARPGPLVYADAVGLLMSSTGRHRARSPAGRGQGEESVSRVECAKRRRWLHGCALKPEPGGADALARVGVARLPAGTFVRRAVGYV